MSQFVFIMDSNLGFPVEDPVWAAFFSKNRIKIQGYVDLDQMSSEIRKNASTFCYLPAANYFYIRSDSFYLPIASALFASNKTTKISSLLVVSKDSHISSLSQLKGKRLGYINTYCTSSYFAPAILLHRNGYSFQDFFSERIGVGAWQKQIDAVIAGKVDATMVQEDVWHSLPSNAQKTKILDQVDNLPSPLILCAPNAPEGLKKEFVELLLSHQATSQAHLLFNGFTRFQKELVSNFYTEAAAAL
jgi:phosphonate transport system substrate-binding protein